MLDELERVLGIGAFPVNWPIGNGADFKGVFDRHAHEVHLFERTVGGQFRAPVSIGDLSDPVIRERLDEADLSEGHGRAGHAGAWRANHLMKQAVLAGKTTPVFFGSAANNFGVKLMLDGFLKHSSAAASRITVAERHHCAGTTGVLGFYFQDPGEHGSHGIGIASRSCGFVRESSSAT